MSKSNPEFRSAPKQAERKLVVDTEFDSLDEPILNRRTYKWTPSSLCLMKKTSRMFRDQRLRIVLRNTNPTSQLPKVLHLFRRHSDMCL